MLRTVGNIDGIIIVPNITCKDFGLGDNGQPNIIIPNAITL